MAGSSNPGCAAVDYALLFVRILKAKRWIKTSKEAWAVISWFINNEAVFTIGGRRGSGRRRCFDVGGLALHSDCWS